MVIAVPTFNQEVAPSFDFASMILLFHLEGRKVVNRVELKCLPESTIQKVRRLHALEVESVLCDAIKSDTVRILNSFGIDVVSGITGNIENVIQSFLQGKIERKKIDLNQIAFLKRKATNRFFEMGIDLLKQIGYSLQTPTPERKDVPIDYIGIKTCPVCNKPIRIAVCCGNHLYEKEQEIKEFVFYTEQQYDARVYIHPMISEIAELCEKHQIELLDPCKRKSREWDKIRQKFYSHISLSATKGKGA